MSQIQVNINAPQQYKPCRPKQYSAWVCKPPVGTAILSKVLRMQLGQSNLAKRQFITASELRGLRDTNRELFSFIQQNAQLVCESAQFVLCDTRGELSVIDNGSLANNFIFSTGEPISSRTLFSRCQPVNAQGLVYNCRVDSGTNILNTAMRWARVDSIANQRGITFACFVPKSCIFQLQVGNSMVVVNEQGVDHGKGDFILCSSTPDGKPNLNNRWVVNGLVFRDTYNNQGWTDKLFISTASIEVAKPQELFEEISKSESGVQDKSEVSALKSLTQNVVKWTLETFTCDNQGRCLGSWSPHPSSRYFINECYLGSIAFDSIGTRINEIKSTSSVSIAAFKCLVESRHTLVVTPDSSFDGLDVEKEKVHLLWNMRVQKQGDTVTINCLGIKSEVGSIGDGERVIYTFSCRYADIPNLVQHIERNSIPTGVLHYHQSVVETNSSLGHILFSNMQRKIKRSHLFKTNTKYSMIVKKSLTSGLLTAIADSAGLVIPSYYEASRFNIKELRVVPKDVKVSKGVRNTEMHEDGERSLSFNTHCVYTVSCISASSGEPIKPIDLELDIPVYMDLTYENLTLNKTLSFRFFKNGVDVKDSSGEQDKIDFVRYLLSGLSEISIFKKATKLKAVTFEEIEPVFRGFYMRAVEILHDNALTIKDAKYMPEGNKYAAITINGDNDDVLVLRLSFVKKKADERGWGISVSGRSAGNKLASTIDMSKYSDPDFVPDEVVARNVLTMFDSVLIPLHSQICNVLNVYPCRFIFNNFRKTITPLLREINAGIKVLEQEARHASFAIKFTSREAGDDITRITIKAYGEDRDGQLEISFTGIENSTDVLPVVMVYQFIGQKLANMSGLL